MIALIFHFQTQFRETGRGIPLAPPPLSRLSGACKAKWMLEQHAVYEYTQTPAESSCWNRWVWLHFLATTILYYNHKRPRKLRNFPWKGCSHIIFIQPKKECRLETILCIQLAFHVHSLATIASVSARACWPWQGCTQGRPKKLCKKLSPASAYRWMKASPQWANKWRKDKSQGKWYLYTKVWCQPTGQGLFTL